MSKNNFTYDSKELLWDNKESKIIDTIEAFEELNKKIPINIDKTLDPANNSIGLYGLADMVLLKIFDFHAV